MCRYNKLLFVSVSGNIINLVKKTLGQSRCKAKEKQAFAGAKRVICTKSSKVTASQRI